MRLDSKKWGSYCDAGVFDAANMYWIQGYIGEIERLCSGVSSSPRHVKKELPLALMSITRVVLSMLEALEIYVH